jgi:hypothetical protein
MRDVIQNAETWGKVLEDMDGAPIKVPPTVKAATAARAV